ncbi:hypothetical protein JM47_00395 [Ureaplasma diversum]|uniref:Uncharacterized protein n=2 Tax=Ureaplasma diversum TaxID=42094 RepID=A0A0C5RB11_9BACT|nr:ATP-binding protein [Ureaplasma diversum]AJQ45121.1 hypothetical protein JM47_00395 [Ureaplasma diversum]KEZ23197.1 putative DNA helicase [Ureaplasma diversum NCTC 246]
MQNQHLYLKNSLNEVYETYKDEPIIKQLNITKQEFVDHYSKILFYLENYQTQNLDLIRDLNNNLEVVYTSNSNDNILNECYWLRWVEKVDNQLTFSEQYLNFNNLKDNQYKPSISQLLYFLSNQIKTNQLESMYLSGNTITGKSWITTSFINSFILKHKISVCYIEMDLLIKYSLNAINNSDLKIELEQAYEAMRNCNLLVLDNFGNERYYDFVHNENILKILRSRFKNNLPIFFISNIDLNQLTNHYLRKQKHSNSYEIQELILIINDLITINNKQNIYKLEGRWIWDLRKGIDKKL